MKLFAALGIIGSAFLVSSAMAQTAASTPHDDKDRSLSYELVSIHKSKPDAQGYEMNNTEDGITARAINLKQLVSEAFGFNFGELLEGQLVGLPEWGKSQKFDILAKVDADDVPRFQALRKSETMVVWMRSMVDRKPTAETAMLQQLITDRFHLKMHYEQRVMPVFTLTVAKGGLKMKAAHSADPEHGSLSSSNGKVTGVNVPPVFVTFLMSQEVGRPIVDRTGLTDQYNFEMNYAPNAGMKAADAADAGPSLFTALEEQLGLKLVPAKEPVWVIVIDSVQMPDEN